MACYPSPMVRSKRCAAVLMVPTIAIVTAAACTPVQRNLGPPPDGGRDTDEESGDETDSGGANASRGGNAAGGVDAADSVASAGGGAGDAIPTSGGPNDATSGGMSGAPGVEFGGAGGASSGNGGASRGGAEGAEGGGGAAGGAASAAGGANAGASGMGGSGEPSDATCNPACSLPRTCSAGQCVCPSRYADCSNECVLLDSNPEHCGSCSVTCDEGCSAGRCFTTRVLGTSGAGEFEVDSNDIYYSSATPEGAGVFRVPRGGGSPTLVTPADAYVSRFTIHGDTLYWHTVGSIVKMPLAGGQAVELITGQIDLMFLTVDSSYVYYSTYDDGIYRVPIDGGSRVEVASRTDATQVVNLLSDDRNVYWTVPDNGGSILKVPHGGDSSQITLVNSALTGVYNFAWLAAHDSYLYFLHIPAGRDPEVARVTIDSGDVTPIAPVQGNSIDVDDDGIYVADDASIFHVSLDGTTSTKLAEDSRQVFRVKASGDEVFWWTQDGDIRSTWKLP